MNESAPRPEATPSQPSPVRRRRWVGHVARLVLLTGTLGFVLGVCEVATRLFTHVVPPLTEKDERIGQRHVQSFEDDIFVPEAGRVIHLRFNNAGFRGPDWPRAKPQGVRRIAVLGDSMISSLAVDEDDTLVCQLQKMLGQTGQRWEVLNFGVAGASPGQELVLYRNLVRAYQPDIVLGVYFVGNDFSDNTTRLSNNPRIYFDLGGDGSLVQQPFSAGRAGLSRWLNRHSRFYVWQKDALNRAKGNVRKQAGALDPGCWVYCTQLDSGLAHDWAISAGLPPMFDQAVRADGGRFVLVMMPSAVQVYRDVFEREVAQAGRLAAAFDWDYPDQRIGQVCRNAGIPFLSLAGTFRAAAPGGSVENRDEWLFHGGTGHFNERGNRLAAEAICRFLTRDASDQVAGRPLIQSVR